MRRGTAPSESPSALERGMSPSLLHAPSHTHAHTRVRALLRSLIRCFWELREQQCWQAGESSAPERTVARGGVWGRGGSGLFANRPPRVPPPSRPSPSRPTPSVLLVLAWVSTLPACGGEDPPEASRGLPGHPSSSRGLSPMMYFPRDSPGLLTGAGGQRTNWPEDAGTSRTSLCWQRNTSPQASGSPRAAQRARIPRGDRRAGCGACGRCHQGSLHARLPAR